MDKLWAILLALFLPAICIAGPLGNPSVNSYVSEAVYRSTNLPLGSISAGNVTVVSSQSVLLHTITVNSPGINSVYEFFDWNVGTGAGAKRIARINTSSGTGTFTYDVYLASGFSHWNYTTSSGSVGTTADVTATYKPK